MTIHSFFKSGELSENDYNKIKGKICPVVGCKGVLSTKTGKLGKYGPVVSVGKGDVRVFMHKIHLAERNPFSLLSDGFTGALIGMKRVICKHPIITTAAVVGVAALLGAGYYCSQDMELRCFEKEENADVAYCAEMPSGLSDERREKYAFMPQLIEKAYYEHPEDLTPRKYSALKEDASLRELTTASWTDYFRFSSDNSTIF